MSPGVSASGAVPARIYFRREFRRWSTRTGWRMLICLVFGASDSLFFSPELAYQNATPRKILLLPRSPSRERLEAPRDVTCKASESAHSACYPKSGSTASAPKSHCDYGSRKPQQATKREGGSFDVNNNWATPRHLWCVLPRVLPLVKSSHICVATLYRRPPKAAPRPQFTVTGQQSQSPQIGLLTKRSGRSSGRTENRASFTWIRLPSSPTVPESPLRSLRAP